jgi:hypothetical protein
MMHKQVRVVGKTGMVYSGELRQIASDPEEKQETTYVLDDRGLLTHIPEGAIESISQLVP